MAGGRPGPKPKRLYLRFAWAAPPGGDVPAGRSFRPFRDNLERVGRLVAHGSTAHPQGDCLILRAVDLAEAERVLRSDPWRSVGSAGYSVIEWDPQDVGPGVNLEPAPARGSGRLTALERITVVVADQDRSARWYEKVLGLRVRERDPEAGYVELSLGRGAAALSLVTPRPEWGEPLFSETRARIGRPTGISFRTDSVGALALRLENSGASVTQGPTADPWGGRTIRFLDLDRNEFLAFESSGGPAPQRRSASVVSSGRRGRPRRGAEERRPSERR